MNKWVKLFNCSFFFNHKIINKWVKLSNKNEQINNFIYFDQFSPEFIFIT